MAGLRDHILPSRSKGEAVFRVGLPLIIYALLFAALGYVRVKGLNPPPDPNDPKAVGTVEASVLRRNLKVASDFINERVSRRELSQDQAQNMLAEYAQELLEHIDLARITPYEAWEYGDLLRTAKHWSEAAKVLEAAVQWAIKNKNEDRRVNDSLRLAQCYAHLGRLEDAMRLARSVMDAKPRDKAPILYAVRLEIVPAARGKGKDLELAKLLEEAIEQHLQTEVDLRTEAGLRFAAMRGYHTSQAWQQVRELYRAAGREDLAQSVPDKMAAATAKYGIGR